MKIKECAARCGKQVMTPETGKANCAYLCRSCWTSLFATLFDMIRTGPEPAATTSANGHRAVASERVHVEGLEVIYFVEREVA